MGCRMVGRVNSGRHAQWRHVHLALLSTVAGKRGGDIKQERQHVWIPSVLKILFYFHDTVQDGDAVWGGTFGASQMQILALWEEGLVKHGLWKSSGLVKCFVTSLELHAAAPGSWNLSFCSFPLSNSPEWVITCWHNQSQCCAGYSTFKSGGRMLHDSSLTCANAN